MLAIRAGVEPAIGCGDRLELTGYRSLEVPGPGAVAHMSLHQKPTMSKSRRDIKRRTAMVSPIYTGGPAIRLMLATDAVGGGSRQRRVGGGHLGAGRDSVNTLLQFYCAFFEKPQNSAGFRLPNCLSRVVRCGMDKPQPRILVPLHPDSDLQIRDSHCRFRSNPDSRAARVIHSTPVLRPAGEPPDS